MNIRRTTHLLLTAIPRAIHRHGYGIQSPWAYQLVRDVLFEPLPYYAYQEQHLTTPMQQQLFRLRNHYRHQPLVIIHEKGQAAMQHYQQLLPTITQDTILIIEHINDQNYPLWETILSHPHTTVTFDMGHRGMATFHPKRIKQNYLL
ncbi:MAG: hypothetical protein IJP82_11060 [Bacteroidaceae bacterium]|nr:hypothetical protein [Bacteroidaceae bacterium]